MPDIKAYYVYAKGEKTSAEVLFATSPGKAKQLGGRILEIEEEFINLRAARAPKYDRYATLGHVPDMVLVRDGWTLWGFCFVCGRHYEFCLDDVDEGLVEVREDDEGDIERFVCRECKREERDRRA